ncbi:GNAT family N-acetyltransferase [Nocardioides cynanchi]|uniref:GNAT family N-acetyltransferase n=1 Tax=Nocardioides cynanchi TaxID=2558918 RepID=UPI0012484FCF|nr:GNAT family N-acetyltransferase [Nocardioides cynanchi]
MRLDEIEAYYDTVPRAAATTEEVGPFTLFLAEEGTGWDFYARPRRGSEHEFTSEDVRRVLARQVELGRQRAIEWVDQVTPSLLPAVRAAGHQTGSYPLLALPRDAEVTAPERTRVLPFDDADLGLAVGAVHAAFAGEDDVAEQPVGKRRELIADGRLIEVAAYDADGTLVGGGSAAPRGETAELMGIGVPPAHRTAGVGTAITRALVRACREAGVRTVFLSAYNDAAASIYRRIGFVDVGTACILGVDDE